MEQPEKLKGIVEGLLAKSRAGQVNWYKEDRANRSVFVLDLQQSKVIVEHISPPTQPDRISVRFADRHGNAALEWSAEEDTPDWPLAQSIITEAKRVAFHGDDILSSLESALRSPRSIGVSKP